MCGHPPPCIEATYSLWQIAPLYRAFLQPHKCRIADLRLITHRPWLALYPPDEFVSGIKGAFDVEMGALLIPSIPLIYADSREPTIGSNRCPNLLTSVRSRVAESCTSLRIPHR
jgi:hypothetical protein